MPGFGRYVTVEELARSGPYTLYTARSAGEEGAPAYVVRSVAIADDFVDPEVAEERARRFVESAELQKKLGEAEGSGWARIYECGKTDAHAYYVTDLFPFSAQRLIDTRRTLDAEQLITIARGVVTALGSLGNRAHGDVRPSNVMIPALEGRAARALLTDPAPERMLSGDALEEDRRGLASLVVQLVTFRPIAKDGVVRDGPEWQRMGKRGDALRVWCERVAAPGGAKLATLTKLNEELDECLAEKGVGGGGGKKLAIAAVVLVVLAGGVGVVVSQMGGGGGSGGGGGNGGGGGGTVTPAVELPAIVINDDWLKADIQKGNSLKAKFEGDNANFEDPSDPSRTGILETTVAPAIERWDEALQSLERLRPRAATLAARTEATEANAAERNALNAEANRFAAETFGPRLAALTAAEKFYKAGRATDPPRTARLEALLKTLARVQTETSGDVTDGDGPDAKAALAKFTQEVDGLKAEAQKLIDEINAKPWDAAPHNVDEPTKEAFIKDLNRRAAATVRSDRQAAINAARDEVQKFTVGAASQFRVDWRSEKFAANASLQAAAIAIEAGLPEAARLGTLRPAYEGVKAWIKEIDTKLGGVTIASPAGAPGVAAAAAILGTQREEAIKRLGGEVESAQALGSDASKRIDDSAAALRAFAESVDGVVKAGADVDALLASGALVAEAGAGGVSLEAIETAIKASPANQAVPALGEAALAKVAELRAISGEADKAVLIERIRRSGAGPSEVRAAWERLGALGYPANPAELGEARTLARDYVKKALQGLEASRRTALEGGIDASLATLLERLRTAWFARANAATGVDWDAHFAEMTPLEIDPIKAESDLKGAAAFNMRLVLLRRKAAELAAKDGDQNEATKAMASAIMAASGADSLAAVAAPAGLDQAVRGRLDGISRGIVFDPEAVGPAKAGWTLANKGNTANDALLIYQGAGGQLVAFRRVSSPGDSEARYVSTAEVSLGLALAVLGTDASKAEVLWRDLAVRYQQGAGGNEGKLRLGPMVWEYSEPRKRVVSMLRRDPEYATGWLRAVGPKQTGGFKTVQGLPAEPPTAASPMNYISARGALFVAALMGCRLPTQAEWDLARAADQAEGNEAQNLRDATFAAMHGSMVEQLEPNVVGRAWPHAESYTTLASGKGGPLTGEEALLAAPKVAPGSDGFVFFRPVDGKVESLTDLGGNVSEWILAQDPGTEPQATAAAVNAIIAKDDAVRVAGASAVGDPEFVSGPGPGAVGRTANFSDVGFRLAFKGEGGGSGRLADQLVKVLAQVGYRSAAN